MPILLHALVALAYLGAAVALWWTARSRVGLEAARDGPQVATYRMTGPIRVAIVAGWLLHAWVLRDDALVDGHWRFGFALALSATMWLVLLISWVEMMMLDVAGFWLVLLPVAAGCALLPLPFPGSEVLGRMSGAGEGEAPSPWLPLHLAVALAAYGLLTIAALHAFFMAALDRWLHRDASDAALEPVDAREVGQGKGRGDGGAHRLLAALPPLLTMERALFRLIGAGFALLTLTVLTGMFFSEALFGRPMRVDHKTVFTLVAWVVFGALLAGRATRGWRGRTALSWTIGGFTMLFLAYAGSRFVLEVVLHRV